MRLRREIASEIQRSIAILDGDADLEDGGDDEPDNDNEPSLGATLDRNQVNAWKAPVFVSEIDLEQDGDGRPDADAEPSLGSLGSC